MPANILAAFAPVLVFLGILILLDSYKLVRSTPVATSVVAGGIAALAAWAINVQLLHWLPLSGVAFSRYCAPVVEELLKATWLIVLIRSGNPSVLSERVRSHFSDRDSPYLELRDYGTGAQILLDIGVREMVLMSNTKRTMIAIEGYGLKIVEQRPIQIVTDLTAYSLDESHDNT